MNIVFYNNDGDRFAATAKRREVLSLAKSEGMGSELVVQAGVVQQFADFTDGPMSNGFAVGDKIAMTHVMCADASTATRVLELNLPIVATARADAYQGAGVDATMVNEKSSVRSIVTA